MRPHCSTCIRSYKHLLRTAPSTNPVLTCEYDDDKEHHPDGEEDDAEARRKRRKTSGSRKKADEEAEQERERLNKRIGTFILISVAVSSEADSSSGP